MSAEGPRAYLDHNATSPMRPEAVEAWKRALDGPVGNPASLHEEGRAARALVEQARDDVAAMAGADSREIVFTSGGSEAIAAGIRGVCDRAPAGLRRIVVSSIEHSAVLESARLAARARGFEVELVGCDRLGRVDADEFLERLDRDVVLAALQWANNETGVLQPVEEVGRACRARGIAYLVDAVQAVGKIPADGHRVHADMLAISGHKLGGPQGVGALVVRDGIVLAPLIGGGAQEKRRRAGTPPVACLAAFGAAARGVAADRQSEAERLLRLRAKLETRLRGHFPDIRFHGQAAPRLPNTVNFSIPAVAGETLAIALDLEGISVSTGSACASGAVEPSHVLLAMGLDEAEARGAIRVSLGWSTTEDDVDRLLERIPHVVARARDPSDGDR